MFCEKCKYDIPDESTYCLKCGKEMGKLDGDNTSSKTKNSKETFYKIVMKIIFVIIYIYIFSTLISQLNFKDEYKSIMYRNFEDFGIALEHLNDNLSQLINNKNYDFNKDKKFIGSNEVRNFNISLDRASQMTKDKTSYYYFTGIYYTFDKSILNILEDKKISSNEKEYLETLYEFNDKLIKSFRDILGTTPESYDFDTRSNLEKKIPKIYTTYSKEAEALYNSDKYKFLQEYEGDFKAYDVKEIQNICEDTFAKLISKNNIEYNKSKSNNSEKYVFNMNNNFKQDDLIDIENKHVPYEITYNKKNRQIKIHALSYVTSPTKTKYKELELDNIAKEIVSKFNNNVFLYDRNMKYDDKGNLEQIKYKYIQKEGIIYDETKKIEFEIQVSGVLSEFIIVDYKNNFNKPSVVFDKESLLSKLQLNQPITNDLVIRTSDNKMLYIAYFNYKGSFYEEIYDIEQDQIVSCSKNHKYDYLSNDISDFYGKWRITDVITCKKAITSKSDNASELKYQTIIYTPRKVIFQRQSLNNPVYKKEVISSTKFVKDTLIPLNQLGINVSSITSINIYDDQNNSWDTCGSSFFIIDKNNMILYYDEIYFKLIRF